MSGLTVLVDCRTGNLHSAEKAFQRMAAEAGGGEVLVSARPEDAARADRIVLPGDGAFAACRYGLTGEPGLLEAMEEAVTRRGRPFLGICVGMQLMATEGREHGRTPGLDWIAGTVVRIEPGNPALKVPHMGWNDLVVDAAHPVLGGIDTGEHAYFVHSYHFLPAAASTRIAHVDHGGEVTAIVARDTTIGLQFHPEKSQAAGLRMIANFLAWSP